MKKKQCAAFVAMLVAASAAGAAPADAPYPCTAVRLVAPNPPGGATDVLSRLISAPLQQRLGVPVIVENRGGASTNIGNEYVVRSPPEGCTLLLGNISMALNKSLMKLKFDIESDLRAVIQVAAVPLVVFVNPSLPVKTMREFVDYAKANPNKVNFSSAGNGTPTHLVIEMINGQEKTTVTHVPYRGAGPATADVLAGQIQSSSDSLIPMVPHIKAGNVRAIGVTGKARSPALPDVPTLSEQGYGYADISLWYGIMAPAKTPDALVKRLNEDLIAVLATPEVQARLQSLGSERTPTSPEAFQTLLHSETIRLGALIKRANITLE